jgi:NTP pyrophosphatase (non-canonical NTP hydrolase)
MTFREFQSEALRTDRTGKDDVKSLMIPLLGLAGETGSLLSEYKKWLREGNAYLPFSDQVSEEIGDILWYLANLASKLNLDLGEVAAENLAKIEERWPKSTTDQSSLFPKLPARYDAAFPTNEQLPLAMRVDFIEEPGTSDTKLILRYNGAVIGDPLTDNSHISDGYRYHDVFHLSCGILLGWSPVLRRILNCKRKSVPRIDKVEDGARALVTEEGVSAVVFGHARDYSMFAQSTAIDYELLRTVKGMTRPFEVQSRSLADWQNVILSSFRVWREMVMHRGGTFVGDANTGELRFEAPTW